jgi:hypothetical protein
MMDTPTVLTAAGPIPLTDELLLPTPPTNTAPTAEPTVPGNDTPPSTTQKAVAQELRQYRRKIVKWKEQNREGLPAFTPSIIEKADFSAMTEALSGVSGDTGSLLKALDGALAALEDGNVSLSQITAAEIKLQEAEALLR